MKTACCALALVLAACASVDASRPIDAQEHWFGTTYGQDGRIASATSLRTNLEQDEAARPHMERFRSYERWAVPLGIVGGAALGWGSMSMLGGRTEAWPILAVGVAASVPVAIASRAQNRALRDAVDAHNTALTGTPPAAACPVTAPWVAAAPAPGGGWIAAAGARGTW